MASVEKIEEAILQLPPDEFRQLSEWFLELDQERWDRDLERDVAAGKLDALAEEAINEHRSRL